MENKTSSSNRTKVIPILKALLGSYIVTGILLLILAFLLYRFHFDKKQVNIGIIVIYVVSTFLGGFVAGKITKAQKFVWGAVLGGLYFGLLLLVSLGVYKSIDGNANNMMTTFILCIGSGMAGGMIS